jgi:hypothetical protein
MQFRLTVSREVIGKASREDFLALSDRLQSLEMTMYDLHDHLAVKGHAICCADLVANEKTQYCHRTVASFKSAQVVGVDVDHGKTAFDTLKDDPFLAANAAFAYTTASHTPEHPRYRIVFILDAPIRRVEEYKRVVSVLCARYEGDTNTRDAVRIWYGNPQAETIWFRKTIGKTVVDEMVGEDDEAHASEVQFEAFKDRDLTMDDLRQMLAFVPPHQEHLDWKRTVAGVFNYYGCTDDVCQALEKWSPSTIPYRKLYANRLTKVGIGTVIYIAKKHGYQPPKNMMREAPTTAIEAYDAAESWLLASGQFRYNDVTLCVEYKDVREQEWEPMSDYYVHSCLRKMRASGIKIPSTKIWEILMSDFAPRFNPIIDYFENLPEWRPEDADHIGALAACLPVDTNSHYPAEVISRFNDGIIRKWLVGAVACAIDNHPNHLMPILQGAQGVGKTRFIRYLCPDALRKNHYYEGSISGEKDDKLVLGSSFIAVDDELESMNKREAEAMKGIITKASDRVRPPYGRAFVTIRRIVSYIGSVNRRNFLSDETGSRRFPVIALGGHVDMAKVMAISIDKVWAQALHLYSTRFPYWLDAEDIDLLNEYNKPFQQNTMTDDLVEIYVRAATVEGRPKTATDVAHEISSILQGIGRFLSVDGRTVAAMGKSLGKAGYLKTSKRYEEKVIHGYQVVVSANHQVKLVEGQREQDSF